jgi:hypothetical protein
MNLTPHIKPEYLASLPSLRLSETAEHELTTKLKCFNAVIEPEVIIESIYTWVTSVYLKRGPWFREQLRHTVRVLKIPGKEIAKRKLQDGGVAYAEDFEPILVIERNPDGFILKTLGEAELPDGYYEQRVVEETKAEYF